MSDGSWWNDSGGGDGSQDYQYNPAQTAAAPNQFDGNTVYSPPGQANPIDQYNYVADPNAAGGWLSYPPGVAAPADLAAFSNGSGQYPNDAEAANAIGNSYNMSPTVDQSGNAAFLQDFMSSGNEGGWASMNPQDQQTWYSQYGQQAAPYIWAQQAGLMQGSPEGFNALPQDQQNIWYGTYGQYAPQVWQQQQQANQNVQGTINQMPQSGQGGGYLASQGQYPNGSTVPWNNPYSIGAGTSSVPYGWGVPGFGQAPIDIIDSYMPYLNNPNISPGYIPGSGTYNQYRLDQPGLFGTVAGQPVNLRYGQGGTGDPTTGREVQTPQEVVQGPKLFNSTRTSNWGQGDQAGTGLDYIATLFLRSDTPSGINTAAWSAPQAFWQGLGQQIQQGNIQPTKEGWAALAQKNITPQQLGPAAVQQAQQAGYGGAGAAGGGTGPMGAGTQAFNYQASYLDYLTAMMNNVSIPQLQNQNQQFHDELAFNQAKQKWLEQYQQQTFGESQRQFDLLQGIRQAQTTGMYNGQKTLAAQAQEQQTAMDYLKLGATLRGPADIFQYLKTLQGTPGGIRDIVNSAAGAYRMPTTGGNGVTVGGGVNTGGAANLNSLLDQMNNPNYGAEANNLNLPLPNQINAQNLLRMSPSQRQTLLAAYESAGYRPEDVMSIFQNSLPRYAGQGNAGRVSLFGR
jgi:hypothetical protein